MPRTILHCDCNAFYASVETLLDPSLAAGPMAVCGDPESRHGIILALSLIHIFCPAFPKSGRGAGQRPCIRRRQYKVNLSKPGCKYDDRPVRSAP